MSRIALVLLLSLPLACERGSSTTTPQDCAASTDASTPTSNSPALHAELLAVARSGAKVEKVRVRVDASGAIVKQGIYHDDASAIPSSVAALVEQKYPGAKPKYYETEHYAEHGVVHELEFETADGQACELAVKAGDALLYTECEIDPATLPEPVAARVAAVAPGAKILEAERKTGDGGEHYTIEVEQDGRELYLHIGSDGALQGKHLRIPAIVEVPIE
jgi:hypothetical protein